MGSDKKEKRMKKIKKRRSTELVENGEGAIGASPSDYDEKYPRMSRNEDRTASRLKTNKSKKDRKNKKKGTLMANRPKEAVNEEVQNEGVEPDVGVLSEKIKVKVKKAHKKRKVLHSSEEESKPVQEVGEVASSDVYEISSGDEKCSKGMKKWIKEYRENRPGLKVLQQRIDDFITAHEEQEEQARIEREARVAGDGWTVVVHRKGGKRTTDAESGVAVGAVAEAAVLDKMAKKKSKDVGVDFYRFQRKEAQRSEIMKLQSAYEEDKRRIQQLRAARKFRPY